MAMSMHNRDYKNGIAFRALGGLYLTKRLARNSVFRTLGELAMDRRLRVENPDPLNLRQVMLTQESSL